jgi:Cu+-exporting ATPase
MSESVAVINLSIQGMSCGKCSGKVQRGLESIDGVSSVAIDLAAKSGRVECSEAAADSIKSSIQQKIVELGYTSEFI